MPIVLYQLEPSPPCRAVRLLAEHLEIEMEKKVVDVLKGEQYEDDFVQLNPQHTIPTVVDDDVVLCESRAILMYLANKYGDSDPSLYPTDPDKRALVDMRILYDATTLYARFSEAYFPVIWFKQPLDPAKLERLDEALGFAETFVKDGFIAGSELTVADFTVAVSLSTIAACEHDLSKFPEVSAYLEKCAELMKGWEEVNMVGCNMFGQFFKAAIGELDGN